MTLLDWKPHGWSLEEDIRTIMIAAGKSDTSTKACKAWVRAFIGTVVKGWEPGQVLSFEAARDVGAEFERRLQRAGGSSMQGVIGPRKRYR